MVFRQYAFVHGFSVCLVKERIGYKRCTCEVFPQYELTYYALESEHVGQSSFHKEDNCMVFRQYVFVRGFAASIVDEMSLHNMRTYVASHLYDSFCECPADTKYKRCCCTLSTTQTIFWNNFSYVHFYLTVQ